MMVLFGLYAQRSFGDRFGTFFSQKIVLQLLNHSLKHKFRHVVLLRNMQRYFEFTHIVGTLSLHTSLGSHWDLKKYASYIYGGYIAVIWGLGSPSFCKINSNWVFLWLQSF